MTSSTADWPTISGKPPRHYYGIFPWTVLDQSSGVWQRRKKYWQAQGVDDSAGRDEGLLFTGEQKAINGGTSLFDPVLADLMYQWYAPHGGTVYDPFAGGITRGALAAHHDMRYTGVDLSGRQVESNQAMAQALGLNITYQVGDATHPAPIHGADMILTCPPYHTLERYSDHPRDLSTMTFKDHLAAIRETAAHCYDALANDRFLVWVVGDLRDPRGHLRMLPTHTQLALLGAGFHPVNEHILITPVGTMHRMLRRWWTNTRTAGRRDQRVLVMVKGGRREATAAVNDAYRAHHAATGARDEATHPPNHYR